MKLIIDISAKRLIGWKLLDHDIRKDYVDNIFSTMPRIFRTSLMMTIPINLKTNLPHL